MRLPEARPRVSEYIPEIVTYIGRILDQGFAYSAHGSVYFDTRAFEWPPPPPPPTLPSHHYPLPDRFRQACGALYLGSAHRACAKIIASRKLSE